MQFRNVSNDTRAVVHGLARPQEVDPDGLITVDDDVAESYACQPAIWKRVDGAPAPSPSLAQAQADLAAAQAEVAAASTPAAPTA